MRGYSELNKESSEMVELKSQLKREARRHSNKMIKKLTASGIPLNPLAIDSIHQEFLYATMDGYRTTMKQNRNGDMQNDNTENIGNR